MNMAVVAMRAIEEERALSRGYANIKQAKRAELKSLSRINDDDGKRPHRKAD